MQPKRRSGRSVLLLLLVTAAVACHGGPTPEADEPDPGVTAEMAARGHEIFTGRGNCFTCHGMDARGTVLAPDLTDDTWLNISGEYEEIVGLVRTGVAEPKEHPAPMPPMGGAPLTEEEVRDVAAYVYSLTDS